MTHLNMHSSINPTRQICDYFHVYPPWGHRLENVVSNSEKLLSLDLVRTAGSINKVIHIEHVDGIGLAIVDTEETLSAF